MRFLQVLAVLLLSVVWAAAQTASPTTPTETNTGTTSPGTVTSDSGSKASTSSDTGMSQTSAGGDWIEGCLGGSDGNYTLTDKSGTSYRLTGDTAKLSEHIGHEVKVSGTKSAATAASSSDTMGQTGTSSASSQAIQVTSVKHVAKTCQNSATAPSK